MGVSKVTSWFKHLNIYLWRTERRIRTVFYIGYFDKKEIDKKEKYTHSTVNSNDEADETDETVI